MNLENLDVQEMSAKEVKGINGGSSFLDGFLAGSGAKSPSQEGMSGPGWYSFGYGLALSMK